jgi:hypothetical protein
VRIRKLIAFWCLAASLAGGRLGAGGESPLAKGDFVVKPVGQPRLPDSAYLIREVVYNEVHGHDTHGYWRYWVERHSSKETRLEETVETPDGTVARLELSDGRPITAVAREEEERRLQRLLNSPGEQAQHRKEYAEDERRIGRILTLLPDAFLYDPLEEEGRSERMPECPCYHMRFHPNPDYPAHSIESRIFHAMAGDLWISVDHKRLVRLDGKLRENVDFGYGILGRLYKDGWFRLERTHVNAADGSGGANGDWKTDRLEVHMIGRAMLFKTIARETSEVRGGFTPVPAGLSLQQAAMLVRQPVAPGAQAAALVTSR